MFLIERRHTAVKVLVQVFPACSSRLESTVEAGNWVLVLFEIVSVSIDVGEWRVLGMQIAGSIVIRAVFDCSSSLAGSVLDWH